jgi:hypothetical protein
MQDVLRLSSLITVLIINLVMVGSISAAINPLFLSNNNTASPATLSDYSDDTLFKSITKVGLGADIVPIKLTNTGKTTIASGVLQFDGLLTNLKAVDGVGGSLVVGNGVQLTADSICVGTVTLAPGSRITIRPLSEWSRNDDDTVTTPEPVSLLIWLLIGALAVFDYRRRR